MERAGQNWMGCVLRQEGEPWKFIYRFRYFQDDKIHDSDDNRTWTEVVPPADRPDDGGDSLVMVAEHVTGGLMAKGYSDELRYIPVNGTGMDAQEKLKSAEWAHCRTESRAAIS